MSRARIRFGIFLGAILVASSAAHSLFGWPQLDPFFFIFIIPGLTLVAVSWWPAATSARPA